MKKILQLTLLVICLFAPAHKALALEPVVDGIYYNWTVFVWDDFGKERKCYITSSPTSTAGNHEFAREPYILVTRYKKERTEEVSIYGGYEYKIKSNIYTSIGNSQYIMFTENDIAWNKTAQQDKDMIKDMLLQEKLKVRGESAVGTYTVDEYSLVGFKKAYMRMKELCK